MSAATKTRVVECTQEAFNRLPAMVSRQEFMDWTGYDKDELSEEVHAGRIAIFRPAGRRKARYYKHEIGRLGGFKL
jgi:hypothetical protein